ncbi:MAG: hypothetical protein IH828_10725 [Nitrospinae bacterium]|nr:hypothetical protein [Nitrospinota bacterium]
MSVAAAALGQSVADSTYLKSGNASMKLAIKARRNSLLRMKLLPGLLADEGGGKYKMKIKQNNRF